MTRRGLALAIVLGAAAGCRAILGIDDDRAPTSSGVDPMDAGHDANVIEEGGPRGIDEAGIEAAADGCSGTCGDGVCQQGCETTTACSLDCGALVFAMNDARRITTTGDWASAHHKAECGRQPMIGVSVTTDPVAEGHAALCGSDDLRFPHDSCKAIVFTVALGDNRLDVSSGDWDPGATKGECAQDEYVAGVARDDKGLIDTLLCCKGVGLSHRSCAAQAMYRSAGTESAETGIDWDPGSRKGECNPGRYVAGVSHSTAEGTRSILCCSP